MAVSLDKVLDSTPPAAALEMPVQNLWAWTGPPAKSQSDGSVLLARVVVFSFSIALTALGTYEIYQVISPADVTWLQIVFAFLFALTFAWIAFSCVSACYGFLGLMLGGARSRNWRRLRRSAALPC